jgi:pimeloyl-ACP methyl ester carboxylesterase
MNARTDPLLLANPELRFAAMPSGIRVPYVACGSGEPLVFVHGSLCDYRYWKSQTDVLSKHFLCISVSLSHYWPDHGGSVQREFGWKNHVAELAEFIAALDIGPVHLLGHSRGGCVAFHLAREHAHLAKTLTLADPGGPLQLEGKPQASLPPAAQVVRAKVAALIESGAVDAGLELFVDSVSLPGYWQKSPSGFRKMAIDNAATLPKQFRETLPAYTRAAARDLACWTLLIEGERSPRMYRNNVEHLQAWIGSADKQTIARASHGMNVANSGAFNRLIQAFVSTSAG